MTIPAGAPRPGVKWIKTVDSYRIPDMIGTLREALTTREGGLKVIIAKGECHARAPASRAPAGPARAGRGGEVDPAPLRRRSRRVHGRPFVHAPERLSVADPARRTPTRCARTRSPTSTRRCVGCGVCGEVAHAAVLCPSFYEMKLVTTRAGGAAWLDARPPGRHRPSRRGERVSDAALLGLLIPAVGGQGGGVLSEWIVDAATIARPSGARHVDPGRGATHGLHPVLRGSSSRRATRPPRVSLYPVPGALDVLLAPELLEVGRHDRARLPVAGPHHDHHEHAPALLDPREDRDRRRGVYDASRLTAAARAFARRLMRSTRSPSRASTAPR